MSWSMDYEQIFRRFPTPCLVVDPDMRITAANDTYLMLRGETRNDVVGEPLLEVLPGNPHLEQDPVWSLSASIERVLRTGEADVMAVLRYDMPTTGGSFEERYWSTVNTPLHGPDGRVEQVIMRLDDITEFVLTNHQGMPAHPLRRRTDTLGADVLARAHDLQELNTQLRDANEALAAKTDEVRQEQEAKESFLAALAHELRNPLAAIRGALDVLDDGGTIPDPHAASMLGVVERQTTALTRITDDLLEMTRARVGKLRLEMRLLELGALVASCVETTRAGGAVGEREIDLSMRGEIWMSADPVRITQAISNLVTNAIKFTKPTGQVQVRVAKVDNWATVSVIDDGQGFDPTSGPGLFEPFAQVDSSRTRRAGGLGLGLPIAQSIIELHGGQLLASSDGPNQGATFTIELPLEPTAARRPPITPDPLAELTDTEDDHVEPEIERLSSRRPLSVLIVEDSVDVGSMYKALLEQLGYSVMVAGSGRDGIAQAQEQRPDIILCDIGLPDIDGFNVARHLRADPITEHTPMIALSGYGQDEDRVRAAEAGFDDYLVKPVSTADLAEAVASAGLAARATS